ncbi:MAG: long-chain fatty acid--CoA ligase [Bacteroidaceae bacterium]|nr:long-chain fatty acid--CoA ligase [Bacteroidaceae bacterium]
MLNPSHFSKLIHEQANKYQDAVAMKYRDYELGKWLPITWREFSDKVLQMSKSLLSMGVKVQENIATFSQNKPECLFVDFGAYGVRAVTIPFYATSSGAQVVYMMNDAEIRLLFVGEQLQYDVICEVADQCPTLQQVVIFDSSVVKKEGDTRSMYLDEFLKLGENGDFDAELKQRVADANPQDLANILYTSGTTGNSKGVILTHEMYIEALRVNDAVLDLSEKDVILNFLPFTHVFERAWSYLCLAEGARLAVNLRPQDVQKSLQEVHPTCMCSVPRFWEKVYHAVLDKMENGPLPMRVLIRAALNVGGERWEKYTSKGLTPPLGMRIKFALFNCTIIQILRKTLGLERANFFPTAGAAVSPDVERFVHAAGLNIKVGYGLTESTATVSCDRDDQVVTMGSVGRLVDKLEIKFGENNEVLLRGKTITPGYYKKEEETRAAIDEEGWFHTGDAGYMKDGELYLTERIKDLFKTSNGKYIAPQLIETKFSLDKYIESVVVVANERKFVSALIVPAFAVVEKYAEENGIEYASREDLCKHPQIIKVIADSIEELQADLAHYEKVKRFVLLPESFSMEKGELTNTLKVKRRVVYEKYAKEIEQMYAETEQA